ncbi:hypothetical protein [Pimelobacter simplex]
MKLSITVERVRTGDLSWSALINGREAARGLIRAEAVRQRWRLPARKTHN